MRTEWRGMDEFLGELDDMKERMRVGAARHCFETATLQRDRALANMGSMGIHLRTGRSRALYAVKAAPGSFGGTMGSVAAYAGYLAWPADVVFYPKFLDEGTVKMVARPYHSEAVETAEDFFFGEAGRVYDYARTGRWEP